jgi:acyl transferase domain-containing protein
VTSMGYPSFLGYFCKKEDKMEAPDANHQVITSQCACIAMEYALAKLLISWNITPSYVAGHSLGEYAALCIAGKSTFLRNVLYLFSLISQWLSQDVFVTTNALVSIQERSHWKKHSGSLLTELS